MDNANNENKSGGKLSAIIIVLAIALVISIAIIAVAVFSILNGDSSEDNKPVYDYSYSESSNLPQTTQNNFEVYFSDVVTETIPETMGHYTIPQESAVIENKETTENPVIENYEKLSKNGDNMLSDHYENQYIKLVSAEYGVDTDLLVAIYSVPDTGNNFVLEFDGSKDSDGSYIKSPESLKKVYQIDLERNIKVATENGVGNVGVSYAEGILCFNMVKVIVMEQYPDYFTGINPNN